MIDILYCVKNKTEENYDSVFKEYREWVHEFCAGVKPGKKQQQYFYSGCK